MADVLACIDRSGYANSVCDHAAWFASDPDIGVEVLNVAEPDVASEAHPSARRLVDRAVERLRDEGVGPLSGACLQGSFVEQATARGASVIVMGKRGESNGQDRSRLGTHVEAMFRHTTTPICLTSKHYLPIRRALVLVDADPARFSAVDFVRSLSRLADLPLDVVVAARPDEDPQPKVESVRARLGYGRAEVMGLCASGLDAAVARHMDTRSADLVIVSRIVAEPNLGSALGAIEQRGLWRTRTPVLIC